MHIEDIFDCVKKRNNRGLSLEKMSIQCVDITLKQIQTLVKNIDSIKKSITIDLAVSGYSSRNIQEIAESEEQLSTQFVDLKFRIII